MAGVAGPMLRSRRGAGVSFLLGLAAGQLAAGAILVLLAYSAGDATRAVLPLWARLWLLVAACVLFGAADLANRTPHPWRQVPQRLIYRLRPGPLGVAWGFDLGLLVTTQKVTSLIWTALAAGVLLGPATAAGTLAVITVVAVLAVVVLSASPSSGTDRWARFGKKIRNLRYASGGALMVLSVLTAVQAWHA
jgi:hypothetical protein